jgi:hypothetical protein
VKRLRERGLIAGHFTAAPAYGGEHEALSTIGALDAGRRLRWEAAIVGPGPGIIGSGTEFGHGGAAALDSAHAALALGLPTIVSPRMSHADPRERHRGLSHHTRMVLERLLAPVEVVLPAEADLPGTAEAARQLSEAVASRHSLSETSCRWNEYPESGLPARSMGRSFEDDPLFFAAAVAGGARLGEIVLGR